MRCAGREASSTMGHDGPAPEGVTVATALMDAPADAPSRTARTRAGRPRGLTVQASVDERDVITVRAVGNLDIYTASELRQRLSRHDPAGGGVVLDVSAVTLVDSAGLGTLMSFANRARRRLAPDPHLHAAARRAPGDRPPHRRVRPEGRSREVAGTKTGRTFTPAVRLRRRATQVSRRVVRNRRTRCSTWVVRKTGSRRSRHAIRHERSPFP